MPGGGRPAHRTHAACLAPAAARTRARAAARRPRAPRRCLRGPLPAQPRPWRRYIATRSAPSSPETLETAVSSVCASESSAIAWPTTASSASERSSSSDVSCARSRRAQSLGCPDGERGETVEICAPKGAPRREDELEHADRRLAEREARYRPPVRVTALLEPHGLVLGQGSPGPIRRVRASIGPTEASSSSVPSTPGCQSTDASAPDARGRDAHDFVRGPGPRRGPLRARRPRAKARARATRCLRGAVYAAERPQHEAHVRGREPRGDASRRGRTPDASGELQAAEQLPAGAGGHEQDVGRPGPAGGPADRLGQPLLATLPSAGSSRDREARPGELRRERLGPGDDAPRLEHPVLPGDPDHGDVGTGCLTRGLAKRTQRIAEVVLVAARRPPAASASSACSEMPSISGQKYPSWAFDGQQPV